MIHHQQPLGDKHLDTVTIMSCKREPACFAFLCAHAVAPPQVIDRLHFDIVSADFHRGRASVWATLEMQPEQGESRSLTLLGFDESFLRPFTRAVLETATSRIAHRMTIVEDGVKGNSPRVVDYVRSQGGSRFPELIVTPYEQVLSIGVPRAHGEIEETLFQLPRTDSFLKSFTRMAQLADLALRETLAQMERLAKAEREAGLRNS